MEIYDTPSCTVKFVKPFCSQADSRYEQRIIIAVEWCDALSKSYYVIDVVSTLQNG